MTPSPASRVPNGPPTVVQVLPQEAAINKVFDYFVASDIPGAHLVAVGSEVRINLHGRRIGGWITAVGGAPKEGIDLKPIVKVRGLGPPSEVMDLAMWAAWRWGGRPGRVLRFCGPTNAVRTLPAAVAWKELPQNTSEQPDELAQHLGVALDSDHDTHRVISVRTPPGLDRYALVIEAVRRGYGRGAIVVTPSTVMAEALARRLRRSGFPVALLPQDWAAAASGGRIVVGARAAVFAPISRPGIIVVIDEHDESMKEERTPAWHARDVAIERARRLDVPCVLTSAHPSPEALAASSALITVSRNRERNAWPVVCVIDRSTEEPGRHRLISSRIVQRLREDERVLCILNRTGRAKLLACLSCENVARCETCDAAVQQPTRDSKLICPRCNEARPIVCLRCGSGQMKVLRVGAARAREEIEALALRPVGEVTTGQTEEAIQQALSCAVIVGTEALLHRVSRASTIIFLDPDSDLLAPRYRAAEQTMSMFSRAARLLSADQPLGAANRQANMFIQTRQPNHPAISSVLIGDPARLTAYDTELRDQLGFGVGLGTAVITGESCVAWAELLNANPTIRVSGSTTSGFLVRADTTAMLSDAIARADLDRPPGKVRIEVDPLRI